MFDSKGLAQISFSTRMSKIQKFDATNNILVQLGGGCNTGLTLTVVRGESPETLETPDRVGPSCIDGKSIVARNFRMSPKADMKSSSVSQIPVSVIMFSSSTSPTTRRMKPLWSFWSSANFGIVLMKNDFSFGPFG